jgi:hypothetical protein
MGHTYAIKSNTIIYLNNFYLFIYSGHRNLFEHPNRQIGSGSPAMPLSLIACTTTSIPGHTNTCIIVYSMKLPKLACNTTDCQIYTPLTGLLHP